MKEVWKDIKGYEGLYQISNFGRIKSLEKIIKINNGWRNKEEEILKAKTTGKYNHIKLHKNGQSKNFLIHRLVAEMFIPDKASFKSMPEEDRTKINLDKLVVNHKDENKLNNKADNLEWCTYKYNNEYNGRVSKAIEKTKIKIEQYDLNNNFIKMWGSMKEAIREYKNSHILDVCKGRRKSASGFIWKYKVGVKWKI